MTDTDLIVRELADAAASHPRRRFVEFLGTGDGRTYSEMQSRAAGIGGDLLALGLTPGQRLAVMLDNCVEAIDVYFAALKAGLVHVPLNTALRGASLESALELSSPSALVIGQRLLDTLARSGGEERLSSILRQVLVIVVADGGSGSRVPTGIENSIGFDTLGINSAHRPADGATALPGDQRDPDSPCSISMTSGTTGASKGSVWTDRATLQVARTARRYMRLGERDVVYTCLPIFHTNALHLSVLGALTARCAVAIAPGFSVSRFWADVGRSGATTVNLLGTMSNLLLAAPPSSAERQHRLRYALVIPASPESAELMEQRFGVTPREAYGLSDFGMVFWSPKDGELRPGSCGRVVDGMEAQIVDADGRPVPVGERGELWVRTTRPGVASLGYWGDPEATVASRADFWFHTGDLMRCDSDGWYYFAGRAKDTIRRRGENVSAHEVEAQVLRYPGVTECAVYAIPSPLGEDDVAVAVVLADGSAFDAVELAELVADQLPFFCVPRYVTVLDALPKTSTQKVVKGRLAQVGITGATVDLGERRRSRDLPR